MDKGIKTKILLATCTLVAVACSQPGGSSTSPSVAPAPQPDGAEVFASGPNEPAFCQPTTYSGTTVTISGQATYHARQVFDNGDGTGGLGAAPGSAFPIRYAEIQVLSGSGSVAQCAETDGSGNFSFALPQDSNSYQVVIYSRSPQNDPQVQISVLDTPDDNQPYSLTASVVASSDTNLGILDAPVAWPVLGGAYNIMDQVTSANLFLQSIAGSCSTQFTACPNFTVAPRIRVYWVPGFDPTSYFGAEESESFYVPGYSRMFILGGMNGDVDHSDTDHFDNSVILHEYAHFLEDSILFPNNSPGGPHDGNAILDPRLAWSEGWADGFQAVVLGIPHWYDTYGDADGTTGFVYEADLETPVEGNDYPEAVGEGNYREFSVARFLVDSQDNTPSETRFGFTDNITGRFVEIWAALTRSTQGFNDSGFAFLNVGTLDLAQEWADPLSNGSDFSGIRGVERHIGDTSTYGQYVTVGTCAGYSLTPTYQSTDNGSFQTSDLFRNNRFYYLNITSPLSGTLQLNYQNDVPTGYEADLDFFLYNQAANYGVVSDFVGYSTNSPDGNPATPETQTISLSNLPVGQYLINVRVYTGGLTADPGFQQMDYSLTLNGGTLCPTSLP